MKSRELITCTYLIVSLLILLSGCKKDNDEEAPVPTGPGTPCPGTPTVTYGGKVYYTVLIGNQCWMQENLNIGTMILAGVEMQDNNLIEKYCYDDDPENCNKYGALYQWNEVMQYTVQSGTQGICPDGWHIPTDDDWKVLEGTVDTKYGVGDSEWDKTGFRGRDAGKNLKTISGWGGTTLGTDKYGFSAVPGGLLSTGGNYYSVDGATYIWSSTEEDDSHVWTRQLFGTTDGMGRVNDNKLGGVSVRCIKD